MGIQSYGDYGQEFALPVFIGFLLRNPKRALDNIVHAQKYIRFRRIE